MSAAPRGRSEVEAVASDAVAGATPATPDGVPRGAADGGLAATVRAGPPLPPAPEGPLADLAAGGRRGFPALAAARERTARDLAVVRASLAELRRDEDVAVVLMGSWGRRERTTGSDDDYVVLVDGPLRWREHRPGERPDVAATPGEGLPPLPLPGLEPEEPLRELDVRPALGELSDVLGDGDAHPGVEGHFATLVFLDPLLRHIGLEDDGNRTLTQRMLLLLESLPVLGEDAHARALGRLIDGYLQGEAKDHRPPRFLLNDVMRYWRTIAVDLVAKDRAARTGWGLRNAKLRLGRKVLFAGGLVPILLCHELPRREQHDFLLRQLLMPPTDRLAEAFVHCGAPDEGRRALGAYDRWLALLDDPQSRALLAGMDREDAADSRLFAEVRRHARELEKGLQALLFETTLSPIVREFGVF